MSDNEKKFLDCKGLNCPLPIVKIGQALKKMSVGQELEVEADDPAFVTDVTAFMNHLKQTIVFINKGEITKVCIRKDH